MNIIRFYFFLTIVFFWILSYWLSDILMVILIVPVVLFFVVWSVISVEKTQKMKIIKATLIAKIPQERFRSIDGSKPEIGDIIMLDQGFTFPDGESGCLVYGLNKKCGFRYEAEVYEYEIGANIN
jgi:hypothetical protein